MEGEAIYARCGAGAKMVPAAESRDILGAESRPTSPGLQGDNRELARKILSTSVVKYALKKVGTPSSTSSRILGAMGTKNNQETIWYDTPTPTTSTRPARHGRLLQCPIVPPLNDSPRKGRGGGARAL